MPASFHKVPTPCRWVGERQQLLLQVLLGEAQALSVTSMFSQLEGALLVHISPDRTPLSVVSNFGGRRAKQNTGSRFPLGQRQDLESTCVTSTEELHWATRQGQLSVTTIPPQHASLLGGPQNP